ncbi:hypothetical protein UA08_04614 [Talaromyces atroroseus]|uniref:PH domain-containing protein n=1 Tax=Talaromyces atroroseus TaxID=1441469 RepID=A0A225ARR1_TALAT|nr:hypothetical protein UA08_04614 [Talaromyces atroroseus]OKL59968.1 hypothetical protein UA08_04614 [Talaromyces atroroseus]
MSATEATQPVEEAPAAAPAVAEPVAAEPAPATEAAPEAPAAETTETTEAAPAAEATEATEATAEAPKEEAKEEEVTPATDGTLGYKGPGLVKSFRFAKRFFYFSEDAVEAKNLTSYLASEKSAAAAQRTAAWATQTGKGLLFYTKRAEDKATPAGIFNLSEVSDVSKEGVNEFFFKTNGHKHVFQATSAAERDSWVAALTAKSAEAEAEKETITGSEGYKAELEKITKPAGVATAVKAAAAPEKEAEPAAEDKKEEKKEEKKEDKKSRSQSRKRASIFGSILGGKKEKEEVKEETPATTEATPAEEATAAAEPAAPAEATTETPAEEAAPAAAEAETPAETPAEEKKEEPKTAAKSKRASLFGNFFNKVASPSKEKTEEEVAPVASTAPQLDSPVDEAAAAAKPAEPETAVETPAAEAAVASSSETPAVETAEKKEETTPEAKDKRRTSLFGTLGKKVKSEVTSDGEGKKTNKLGGLFRKPSKAVKSEEEKKEAAPAETIAEGEDKPEPISKDAPVEEVAPATTEKVEEPVVAAEPVNVAPAAAPVQAAA